MDVMCMDDLAKGLYLIVGCQLLVVSLKTPLKSRPPRDFGQPAKY